jgi:hypothetical protein
MRFKIISLEENAKFCFYKASMYQRFRKMILQLESKLLITRRLNHYEINMIRRQRHRHAVS